MHANKFIMPKRQNGLGIITVCLLFKIVCVMGGIGSLGVTGGMRRVGGIRKVEFIGRGGGNSGSAFSPASSGTSGSLLIEQLLSSPTEKELQGVIVGSDCNPSDKKGPLGDITGAVAVLGGVIAHLTLGTMYCWGNFAPYAPPKLRYFAGASGSGTPDTMWVLPGIFVAQFLGMVVSPKLQKTLGLRMTTLLGCWIMDLGILLSSYAQDLKTFFILYGLMFGTGIGVAYTPPLINGWNWFPNRKGLVTGAIVAGFGSGGFIFNHIGSKLINPLGLKSVDSVFPDAVYELFPSMLRKLAGSYFILSILGALLINPAQKSRVTSPESAASLPGAPVLQALKSKTFWTLWLSILLVSSSGLNVVGLYKAFAMEKHPDDHFLSLVGSLGAIANGAGRIFWGNMLDYLGFVKPFFALATIQAIVMALYASISHKKMAFLTATCAILFCLGGNFAMFPPLTMKVFGPKNGTLIYAFLFSAFSTASISSILLTKSLVKSLGWEGVFKSMAGFSMLSVVTLLALCFKDEPYSA